MTVKKQDKSEKMTQLDLFEMMGLEPVVAEGDDKKILAKKPVENSTKRTKKLKKVHESATPLMKTVASRTMEQKNLEKSFSPKEITEIKGMVEAREKPVAEKAEGISKEQYRKIKRRAKELERGNQSKVIVFPSKGAVGEWYKVGDISALYYAYRLADRMGRSAKVVKDNDHFSKMIHICTLVNMPKFIEQFKLLEGMEPEITEEGIYIFPMKRALSEDEVGMLRRTEETRRERLHNVLRPKAMSPEAYQAILMVARQIVPKARKLDGLYAQAIGSRMIKHIEQMMQVYFMYTDGLGTKWESGAELMRLCNALIADVAMLSENRVWDFVVATPIGENINAIKNLVKRDFGLDKKSKENN